MKISAVFIVKNEEGMLERALESVKDFDEIVLVDTGSTDRTIEIAQKYTSNIYHFPWIDDFAAARNFAISKATGDWILSVDADHWVMNTAEEVRSEAEKAEKEGEKSLFVASVSNGVKFSHWGTTLFKREGAFWTGKVHEYLTPKPTKQSTIKKGIGYSGNHAKDPDRNLRILQSYENKGPRQLFYLGREYYERRRYQEAIDTMGEFLQVGSWHAELAEARLVRARCFWFTQRGNEAREECLQAIKINPDFKEALQLMSAMHFEPWKSKWANLASVATNKDVLFVRT